MGININTIPGRLLLIIAALAISIAACTALEAVQLDFAGSVHAGNTNSLEECESYSCELSDVK